MHVVERLISELSKLPGVGRKSATRLAFHIIKLDENSLKNLSNSIVEIPMSIEECNICCNYTKKEENPCPICSSAKRKDNKVIIVNSVQDLMSFEDIANFDGKYHVLHGLISPMRGIGIDDIRIKELLDRLDVNENEVEIILALTPNIDGETTAIYIKRLLKEYKNVSVTQIANGVPIGSELEYVDKVTLIKALENRS